MARNKDTSVDDPGEGPVLSEEEWADFERSFTKESTKSATYKEPSARQRELTEKWKKEQPKDTGWRTDGGYGGASSASIGKRRRRWVRNLVWVLVAALVTVAIIAGPKLFSSSKSSAGAQPNTLVGGTAPGGGVSATGPASSAGSPSSTAAAPAAAGSTNPDDQYFDGSPSLDWQNNEAGIVPPAATPIGNYSAKTVGDAYAALRQMLITADLDPAVLRGAEPTAMFKLLDPSERIKQDYEKRVAKPGSGATDDPKAFATRFNPSKANVLGKTVKVHGSMSAAVDKDGNLVVTGDYSFVYALAPAGGQGLDRSLVRRVWNLEVQPTTAGSGTGYWFSGWWYDIANDDCNVADGFINPAFGGYGGADGGKIVDPYATTPPPTVTSAPSDEPSSSANACHGVKPV